MTDLGRRILAARSKLTAAKAQIDLHTKAASAAQDELLVLLSDPAFEQALLGADQPSRSQEAVPVIQPGIRDVSTGAIVAARTPQGA